MRLLHTADWHLGRLFHGVHLTDDQAHVLDQLVDLAAGLAPDALVVAGDLYDRAVPPPEAVDLLDDVLTRLVDDVGVPVVAIAGNHDSPSRIEFGSRLLAGRGLHLVGVADGRPSPIRIDPAAGGGPVDLHALPYAEPSVVRAATGDAGALDHDRAMRARLARLPAGRRRVVVGHAFVAGGLESASERPLSVGGAGTVGADAFAGFDYVALGHLHRPQTVAAGRIRYSGSLLKYSFDEAGQSKGVDLVELGADGTVAVESHPLVPRRDVRVLEGPFDEVLAAPPSDDYLLVRLTDRGPILDALGRLREVHANVLVVERPHLALGQPAGPGADHRRLGDVELFAGFYAQVTGGELAADERDAFAAIVEGVRRSEREA